MKHWPSNFSERWKVFRSFESHRFHSHGEHGLATDATHTVNMDLDYLNNCTGPTTSFQNSEDLNLLKKISGAAFYTLIL